jgi:hypothetical protein
VKYVEVPLNEMEDPPLDIWLDIPASINVGLDLLYKWYKDNKNKDPKVVKENLMVE